MRAVSRARFSRVCRVRPPNNAGGRGKDAKCKAMIIVGGGRVGNALAQLQDNCHVIRRGETFPADVPGPVVVCTRNNSLSEVLQTVPPSRHEDLVFIQNGMLQPWLESQGLGDCTQALIYFAVAKLGDAPTDGITDANPEGLTAVCGKHAEAFAAHLHAGGLTCAVLEREEYTQRMLEKLMWICAFMLVGVRNGGCTVGDVESKHQAEVLPLLAELRAVGEAELGVSLDGGYQERLCAYARSVAHFPTALKELEWRNGWFQSISKRAKQSGKPDPCPLHTDWLQAAMSGVA